jgi:hypothetical protein
VNVSPRPNEQGPPGNEAAVLADYNVIGMNLGRPTELAATEYSVLKRRLL